MRSLWIVYAYALLPAFAFRLAYYFALVIDADHCFESICEHSVTRVAHDMDGLSKGATKGTAYYLMYTKKREYSVFVCELQTVD